MKLVVLVGMVLTLTIFMACGGNQVEPMQSRLTVAQYAEAVCEHDVENDVLWGEVRAELESDKTRVKGIIPPTELKDYHQANLALMEAVLESIKDKDANAPANPFEMVSESNIMVLAILIGALEEAMDPGTAELLTKTGFIE